MVPNSRYLGPNRGVGGGSRYLAMHSKATAPKLLAKGVAGMLGLRGFKKKRIMSCMAGGHA